MNKYIKNIVIKSFIIGILALNFVSCTKFLDKNPLDQISSPTFWKTQSDADMALAGVYARLLTGTFNFGNSSSDIAGGDLLEPGMGSYTQIAEGLVEATSGGPVSDVYSECYTGISSCNFFLENIDRVPITDDIKNKYKGEVRFLRALFYFTLTNFYGGVPLYTKMVTIEEAKVKQSTKEVVIAQVISDLDFAIANLPNTAYNGHAVQGTALALKAKVLLYNQQWQGAADAANQVIQDGKFSLYNNYSTLFLTSGQQNNPEIIFSAQYLLPDRYSSQDILFGWFNILNPRQQFVDDFECTDGLPITSSPLYDPTNWKKNRDPRLIYTVRNFFEPGINSAGKVVNFAYTGGITDWADMKGMDIDKVPMDYSTKSEQDWILLRYADVLMMYAEAKNEVSGPDASVYSAINTVRARPGINMPPIPAGLTKDQMRVRIMHERRVEFGCEGLRYFDMKRWKTIETYLPTLVNPGGIRCAFNPARDYVLPFPQSEIDINTNLKQNDFY